MLLKFIKSTPMAILIIFFLMSNNSVSINSYAANERSVYITDTMNLKGCLIVYRKKGSDDTNNKVIKIFIPDEGVESVKKESLNNLIKRGYVYVHSSEFMKLLYFSEDREKYKNLNYDKELSIKGHKQEGSVKIWSGVIDYYSVETTFIISLVKESFYEQRFWSDNSWFCSNSYIKVISPNSFVYLK